MVFKIGDKWLENLVFFLHKRIYTYKFAKLLSTKNCFYLGFELYVYIFLMDFNQNLVTTIFKYIFILKEFVRVLNQRMLLSGISSVGAGGGGGA